MNETPTCPECGSNKTQTALASLWVGPGWQLSVDIHYCQACGWVIVTDWFWSKRPDTQAVSDEGQL